METLWEVQIAGVGRYLPRRVVSSAEVEAMVGLPEGYAFKRSGVKQRRWAAVSEGESAPWMGAQAALEALERANVAPDAVDLILNASGSPAQAIPDGGPLIQREMGLGGSGIPSWSVSATCLSFLLAVEVAAERLTSGRADTVLIVSTDIASSGLDFGNPEIATLFGDAAAAIVLVRTPPGQASAVHRFAFTTYGDGADLTAIPGAGSTRPPHDPRTDPTDSLFHMDGPAVLEMAVRLAPPFMMRLGVLELMGDIDRVIPHQTSKAGIKAMEMLGFPPEKISVTLDVLGNCVGASIPATLYEAIESDGLTRGDLCLMCGTGAGLSLGGMIFTY